MILNSKSRISINEAFNIPGLNYIKNKKIEELEKYFLEKCKDLDLEISIDVTFDEILNFKTLAYTNYAGSILAYPLSQKASDAYIFDMLEEEEYEAYEYPKPKDKYILNNIDNNFECENLVILPGDNMLKFLVNKNALIKISKMKNVIVKLHPLTDIETKKELQILFKNNIVIDSEYELYDLFFKAKNIFTSSASETVFFSALYKKNIFIIDEYDKNKKITTNYTFISKYVETSLNANKFINKLLNSKISCIFNPEDPNVLKKIDNYINYIKIKKEYYKRICLC